MWEVDGGSESATPAFTFTEGAGGEPQQKEPDEAESTHKSVGHKFGFVKRAHVQLAGQAAELKARLEEHAGNEYAWAGFQSRNLVAWTSWDRQNQIFQTFSDCEESELMFSLEITNIKTFSPRLKSLKKVSKV